MNEGSPRGRRAVRRLRRELGDLRSPGATMLRWLRIGPHGEVRFGQHGLALDEQPDDRVTLGEGVVWGDHVAIHLGPEGRLEIGAGAVLGSHVLIAADDLVRVGPDCRIGDYTVLVDTWSYGTARDGPVPPPAPEPVEVGAGSHLGMRVTIGPGVHLPAGAHVGTGSVLHRDEVAS